jgi:cell division protein ZapE
MKEKNHIKINENKTKICDIADQYMFYIRQTNLDYDESQYILIKKIDFYINSILKLQNNFFLKANYLFLKKFNQSHKHIFYLHGNVGSGKTFITNLIFRTIPIKNDRKLRLSFYEFIDMLRNELNKINLSLNENQKNDSKNLNKENFKEIIKRKLKNIDLLCIDEFHVLDISDAMIILEFFKVIAGFPKMIVIINSNRAPEDLYKTGIHRERFIPVIDLIKKHSHIMLLSTKDYRQSLAKNLKSFLNFGNDNRIKNQKDFYRLFENFAQSIGSEIKKIDHYILLKKINFDIIQNDSISYIYFDFCDFFSKPLYAKNYQKFLRHFCVKKIYINNLFNLDGHDDLVKRFIAFVDVAYELGIGFFIGSKVSLDEVYKKGSMIFEFDRIISRINVLCR